MNPEQEFWAAFHYNNEREVWELGPEMSPMDVLEVCRKKLVADVESVARAVDF